MNIKLVIFDFDGVFTNGKIYFSNKGKIYKYYKVISHNFSAKLKSSIVSISICSLNLAICI